MKSKFLEFFIKIFYKRKAPNSNDLIEKENNTIVAQEQKPFFDDEKKKNASDWLTQKWTKNKECEICGSNQWTLAEGLVMSMPFVGRAFVIGGPSYPQLQIICNTCGNTKFLNAVIMGITNDKELAK